MSTPDICPRCGRDRNYVHERDGSQLCWCHDDDQTDMPETPRAVTRVAQLFWASLILTCLGIGNAVITPSAFTIGCAMGSALCSIITLRYWHIIHSTERRNQ
jgi:hypothetical protein